MTSTGVNTSTITSKATKTIGFGPRVLILCCFVVYTTGASCFKVFPCSLSSRFIVLFSIVIISLGEEGAGLCACRAFVLYVLFFVIFLFLLVSGVGCGLWLWHSLDFSINFFSYAETWTWLQRKLMLLHSPSPIRVYNIYMEPPSPNRN